MSESTLQNRRLAGFITAAVAMVAVSCPTLHAQGGGSTYSIFNIGDLHSAATAAGAARAGVETATPYAGLLNSINPATWSTVRYVTIQTGLIYEQYRVSDQRQSIWQNRASLRNFSVAFPFSEEHGGTVGLGIRPYSTVNYRTKTEQDVPSGDTSVSADLTYSGTGGMSEAIAGLSLRPLEELALGLHGSLYFGSLEHRTLVDFETGRLNDAGYVNSDNLSGFGVTAGALIRPTDDLRIGATFATASTLEVDRTELGVFREGGLDDTVSISQSTFDLDLPSRVTVGASYRIDRTVVSAETLLQGWGNHERFANTRDRLRLAVGLDYLPSTSATARGSDRWTLRAGAYREETYYALPQGDINAMGVTFGVNIPFSSTGRLGSGAGMDLGLEFGTRGSTDAGLTREIFGKLWLELAVNELWFQSTRR